MKMSGKRIKMCFILSAILALSSILQVSSENEFWALNLFKSTYIQTSSLSEFQSAVATQAGFDRGFSQSLLRQEDVVLHGIHPLLYQETFFINYHFNQCKENETYKLNVAVLFYVQYLVKYYSVAGRITRLQNLTDINLQYLTKIMDVLQNQFLQLIHILDYYILKMTSYMELFKVLSEWYLEEQRGTENEEEAETIVENAGTGFQKIFQQDTLLIDENPIYENPIKGYQLEAANTFISALLPDAFLPSLNENQFRQQKVRVFARYANPLLTVGADSEPCKIIGTLLSFIMYDQHDPTYPGDFDP